MDLERWRLENERADELRNLERQRDRAKSAINWYTANIPTASGDALRDWSRNLRQREQQLKVVEKKIEDLNK